MGCDPGLASASHHDFALLRTVPLIAAAPRAPLLAWLPCVRPLLPGWLLLEDPFEPGLRWDRLTALRAAELSLATVTSSGRRQSLAKFLG